MAEQLRKRCLYEVLGVPRESSPDEIRSAYRRLALQLHPDKIAAANGGTTSAAATAAFQELLHAYEVLSDPRERAYYDSHRSQILFSDPSSTSKSHKSSFFNVDLYSYFTNSAFSGFSDTGRGFYKVYGDLFAKLYAQELWFVKELNLDAISPAPLIGKLNSPYTQVTAFYNYWLSFNTVLDFGWVDEYDASLGADRRSRRLMEDENKKARKKAKREFTDSVRGLAAFAKKRDKRVIDMQLKKKLEEEKRREEEKAKKKEEARKRMERAVAFEEPEWARVDEVEDAADESEDERRGKGREEFYCVVCNKKFKSDKQWKNHEQSKKHRDKVADLKTSFKDEEGSTVSEDVEDTPAGFDYVPSEEVEDTNSDALDDLCEEMKDDLGLEEAVKDVPLRDSDQKEVEDVPLRDSDQKEVEDVPLRDSDQKEVEDLPLRDSDEKADSVEEASVLEAMLTGRKNRKSGYAGRDVNNENDAMMQDTKKKNRKARRRASTVAGLDVTSEAPNGASEDQNGVEDKEQSPDDVGQGPSSSVEEVEPVRKSKEDQVNGKNQKSKKVDVKLAANKDKNVDLKPSSKGKKQKGTSKVPNTLCDTCGKIFDTRNKLFAHLGETGHAMLKSK